MKGIGSAMEILMMNTKEKSEKSAPLPEVKPIKTVAVQEGIVETKDGFQVVCDEKVMGEVYKSKGDALQAYAIYKIQGDYKLSKEKDGEESKDKED